MFGCKSKCKSVAEDQSSTSLLTGLYGSLIFYIGFERVREKERERGINLLFRLFMYLLVDSCTCPDRGWNRSLGTSGQSSNCLSYPASLRLSVLRDHKGSPRFRFALTFPAESCSLASLNVFPATHSHKGEPFPLP